MEDKPAPYEPEPEYGAEKEPRLILGFWEMGIIGTLMVVFFPWSLLFCLFVYGMEETKLLIIVLLHDVVKTALAILAVAIPVIVVIALIVLVLILQYA